VFCEKKQVNRLLQSVHELVIDTSVVASSSHSDPPWACRIDIDRLRLGTVGLNGAKPSMSGLTDPPSPA